MPTSNPIIIELVDVDIAHEDAPATVLVHKVRWRVAGGEFWVVAGDQASGKSSLLATAASLNRPVSGTLRLFGRELAQAKEAEQVDWRRRIGFVYENGGRLFSHLTVAENIALPLQYHLDLDPEKLNARVGQLLALAELEPHAEQMPSQLPVRTQQLVALARALAVPTEILFVDNPLSGLGFRDARWWLSMLGEMQTRRKTEGKPLTIVATCSDFRGWVDIASHFAVLQAGQFRIIGGRDQLLGNQEPLVRELVASAI